MLTIDQSAYKTAGRFCIQLMEPPSNILENALTIGLYSLSIILLACRWYANTRILLIPYFYVNSATASLFSELPSIISFLKQPCQQITSFYKKSTIAQKKKVHKGFALTQFDKS